MPYQITQLLESMPTGRVPKPKIDKYADYKELLSQIPEGKVAQIPLPRAEYRALSAALRASGLQLGMSVKCVFKRDAAFVSWQALTPENAPKRRGRHPTLTADPRELDAAVAQQEEQEQLEEVESQPDLHEVDSRLVGDLDAEVSPDVAIFQREARRRQRRR